MTPEEAVAATKDAVLYLGKAFMTDPVTYDRGVALGFKNLEFYMAGRLGVLGPADAEVIASISVFPHPDYLRPLWEAGLAVMPLEETVAHYVEACRDWGRARYRDDAETTRLAGLLERMIDSAAPYGRPLFAGWRRVPRPADGPGRVNQALFLLREQRGGSHNVAVLAQGITPVQAMMARGDIGAFSARYFGWPEPYPDGAAFRAGWEEAERLTDQMAAQPFAALEPGEVEEVVALIARASAQAPAPA